MAALARRLVNACTAFVIVATGCSTPSRFDPAAQTLAQVHVLLTGDLASVLPPDAAGVPSLNVALVWGLQARPEPFCFLPPESDAAAAVIATGCPDSYRFVPDRIAVATPVVPGQPAALDITSLPSADLMVGDLTGRIAYASLIVYEDRNGNGILDIRHPPHTGHHDGEEVKDADPPFDLIYGASFVSMTLPDQRLAYLEGDFSKLTHVAFYPRRGCPDPLPHFSILSAGGFSAAEALDSSLKGELPSEDPTTCTTAGMDETVVIPLQAPATLSQLACTVSDTSGVTRYREPPDNDHPPDFAHRSWACASFPHIPGEATPQPTGQQLVVAGAADDACQSVAHYILRGCDNDPACLAPKWNHTPPSGTPPSWWPCPLSP